MSIEKSIYFQKEIEMKVKYEKIMLKYEELSGVKATHAYFSKILTENGLAVSANALSNRLSNNGFMKEDEIFIIEQVAGLPHGIFTGQNTSYDCIELDYYPNIYASCGSGSTIFDESSEKISVGHALIADYSSNKKYSVILARGNSMEPTLLDEDKLIIEHWQGQQIIDNYVYLFQYDGEIFVKRLLKNVDEIICVSDNADYSNRILKPKETDFAIIGKVVGLFRGRV